MLASSDLVAFVPTQDLDRARAFYGDELGLTVVDQNPFACVFDARGTTLRVTLVGDFAPAPFTALGWQVDDIGAVLAWLTERGIELNRYEGMGQDDLGIWRAPSGDQIAWFKDPDGNTLSVSQSA